MMERRQIPSVESRRQKSPANLITSSPRAFDFNDISPSVALRQGQIGQYATMEVQQQDVHDSIQILVKDINVLRKAKAISKPLKHLTKVTRGNNNITRNRGELYPHLPSRTTSPAIVGPLIT